jgi:hypothetical protein
MNSKKPFILGLKPGVSNSAFLEIETINELIGRNTGNLAYHHAIDIQLGGNLKSLYWHASLTEINQAGEIAILPCSNQLGSHVDMNSLALTWQKINLPIVAIGLGAQSDINNTIPELSPGTLNWVRMIADHAPGSAPNIALRGEFSLEVLHHYGLDEKATVLGCPTFFLNPDPELGKKIEKRLDNPGRIAVVAGNIWWNEYSEIERSLVKLAMDSKGGYIGQGSVEMLELLRGDQASLLSENLKLCRDYSAPQMELPQFAEWIRVYGNVFFDIPAWMEYYRRYDFVVGMRIHGIMLALQAGLPALCIVHDSRTLELCKTMMVPHVLAKDVLNGIEKHQLQELFDFDGAAFDRNRLILAKRYVDFLNANFIRCEDWLTKLAKTSSCV